MWFTSAEAGVLDACDDGACVLLTRVHNTDGVCVAENVQPTVPPHALRLEPPTADISFNITCVSGHGVNITVTTGAGPTALYVALTSSAPGFFDPNWFALRSGETRTVVFYPFVGGRPDEATVAVLNRTARVEHLGMYMTPDVSV